MTLLIFFFILTLIFVWFIVRPILSANCEQLHHSDYQQNERADLTAFIDSLEFERQRGLLADDEFDRLQSSSRKKLATLSEHD